LKLPRIRKKKGENLTGTSYGNKERNHAGELSNTKKESVPLEVINL